MKKLTALWMIVLIGTVSVQAMSLSTMRRNVRFLTDRMAYELQLTSQQYNDVYEVNFDFVYQVKDIMNEVALGYDYAMNEYYNSLDIRNDDLRWILTDYQYRRFMEIDYFYRPLYTYQTSWNFGVFRVYTDWNHFYFGKPYHYRTYLGGHYRIHFGNRSYYQLHHNDHYKGHPVFNGAFQMNRAPKAPIAQKVPMNRPKNQVRGGASGNNLRDSRSNGFRIGDSRANNNARTNNNMVKNESKRNEFRSDNKGFNTRRQENMNESSRNTNNAVRRQVKVEDSKNIRSAQRPEMKSSNSGNSQRPSGVRSQSSNSKSVGTRSASPSRSTNSGRSQGNGSASRHR